MPISNFVHVDHDVPLVPLSKLNVPAPFLFHHLTPDLSSIARAPSLVIGYLRIHDKVRLLAVCHGHPVHYRVNGPRR